MPPPEQRLLRVNMNLVPMPGPQRPREIAVARRPGLAAALIVGLRLPDGDWLNLTLPSWSRRGPGTRRPSWSPSC